ncbi:diguanylate cyclase [Edwardsiella hoshinae]|uniref:Putative diguanylate cyclase YedQ n=1 Tax=Edwardsiella hoshinae TaxID=93378 RepID=A0A376DGJ9_9GAMM|nr:diguanylate cyclase [Edwardsiella hoshinae]QPR26905.1 diguanylate cyclase [Edwardsiella hoshinae]STC89099.1 putative diguanylate cyclase YedQ [Edwardsiella hoshinae]
MVLERTLRRAVAGLFVILFISSAALVIYSSAREWQNMRLVTSAIVNGISKSQLDNDNRNIQRRSKIIEYVTERADQDMDLFSVARDLHWGSSVYLLDGAHLRLLDQGAHDWLSNDKKQALIAKLQSHHQRYWYGHLERGETVLPYLKYTTRTGKILLFLLDINGLEKVLDEHSATTPIYLYVFDQENRLIARSANAPAQLPDSIRGDNLQASRPFEIKVSQQNALLNGKQATLVGYIPAAYLLKLIGFNLLYFILSFSCAIFFLRYFYKKIKREIEQERETFLAGKTPSHAHGLFFNDAVKRRVELDNHALLRDPLTKLYNRRKYDYDIAQRLYQKFPFYLLLLELDAPPSDDTSAAHEEEELRLTQLAALFAQYQEGWRFYRLGGDVFAALLDKRHVADRRALAQCCDALLAEAAQQQASLSIGASDSAEASERLVLQTLADNRLYISKHRGKNCATLPPERPEASSPAVRPDDWPVQ